MKFLVLVIQSRKHNTKITEIEKKLTDQKHGEYITTPEFNKLAANVFNMRLAQANLVTKTDLDAKLSSLNKKITSNKTRHLLIKNELGYFRGKNHFDENGTQNYYIFQPISKYLKAGYVSDINCILS